MTWADPRMVLTTKLFMPLAHSPLVERQRLAKQLDDERPLTLVVGGAGWGKSTLLAQWAAALPYGVGWVSLDEGDNDVIRFLVYCVAAWQQADSAFGETLLAEIQTPQSASAEEFLLRVINALALRHSASPTFPLTLILDDFHSIKAPAVLEAVTTLIERLPPSARVIIASRSEPALPLGRWRVRGRLAEVRAADLRFTNLETEQFFHQTFQLDLPPEIIVRLEERTEGWIAGLHLAGLLAQKRSDVSQFVDDFTGSHRFVIDYLAEEVLRQQSPEIQQFLLATAILEEFCAPLCAAVLDEPAVGDVQALLEHLERSNLFLLALDAEMHWFRYHHLFAELLRYRLKQSQPEIIALLHRRASAWLSNANRLDAAISHSLEANDIAAAESLIATHARNLLMRGEAQTVLAWLNRLPEAVIRNSSQLAVADAWARLVLVQPNLVGERLRWADAALSKLAPTELRRIHDEMVVIRAILPRFADNIHESITLSKAALRAIAPDDVLLRGILAGNLVVVQTIVGDIGGASEAAALAVSANQTSGNTFGALLAIGDLGLLQLTAGHLHAAAQTFQKGLRLAQSQGWEKVPALGTILMGLAQVFYEWNDLEEAMAQVNAGIAVARSAGYLDIMTDGLVVQARIKLAQGAIDAAQRILDEAARVAHRNNVVRFGNRVRSLQIHVLLHKGDQGSANQLARTLPVRVDSQPDPEFMTEYLALLNLLLARKAYAEALELSERIEAVLGERVGARLLVLIVRTIALVGLKQTARAQQVLEQALELGQHGDYVRSFLDSGTMLAGLLQQSLTTTAYPGYVSRLLATWLDAGGTAARAAQSLVEPLSDRELEVLRLLAGGLSNQEIANRLIISVGTVKRHVINIYGKLDAHSRTAAVAKARELKLLQ